MKVYTKTGDKGETSLYDGNRAPKYAIIFEVLGEMDELSSRIGMLCAMLNEDNGGIPLVIQTLRSIQRELQDYNSHIATLDRQGRQLPELDAKMVEELENHIDHMENGQAFQGLTITIPKLTKFILSGVTPVDGQAHMCRTQARKAERVLAALHSSKEILTVTKRGERAHVELKNFVIPEVMLQYMNRLSDYFFVLARWLCHVQEQTDCLL